MKKILIIDDEKDFCFFVKKNLEQEGGYAVAGCSNPHEAISKVTEFKPDLIFLDIMMPDIDGGTMAELIRNDPGIENIPIVILTAIVTKDEAKKGMNLIKGNYFLSKPVTTQELIGAIEELTKYKK